MDFDPWPFGALSICGAASLESVRSALQIFGSDPPPRKGHTMIAGGRDTDSRCRGFSPSKRRLFFDCLGVSNIFAFQRHGCAGFLFYLDYRGVTPRSFLFGNQLLLGSSLPCGSQKTEPWVPLSKTRGRPRGVLKDPPVHLHDCSKEGKRRLCVDRPCKLRIFGRQ